MVNLRSGMYFPRIYGARYETLCVIGVNNYALGALRYEFNGVASRASHVVERARVFHGDMIELFAATERGSQKIGKNDVMKNDITRDAMKKFASIYVKTRIADLIQDSVIVIALFLQKVRGRHRARTASDEGPWRDGFGHDLYRIIDLQGGAEIDCVVGHSCR